MSCFNPKEVTIHEGCLCTIGNISKSYFQKNETDTFYDGTMLLFSAFYFTKCVRKKEDNNLFKSLFTDSVFSIDQSLNDLLICTSTFEC